MGMIPIFDDPHAISLTPNPELGRNRPGKKRSHHNGGETLADHIIPANKVPEDAFVDGAFERLPAPEPLVPGAIRGPIRVAILHVGGPDRPIVQGSMVNITGDHCTYRVLNAGGTVLGLMNVDKQDPIRRRCTEASVSRHLHQTLDVFSTEGTLISPRT